MHLSSTIFVLSVLCTIVCGAHHRTTHHRYTNTYPSSDHHQNYYRDHQYQNYDHHDYHRQNYNQYNKYGRPNNYGQNERADQNVEGYCWRDYTGVMPKDAVTVTDETNTIFIGQGLGGGKIVPGALIYRSSGIMLHYGYNNAVHQITGGLKVLCSHRPEELKWQPVLNMNSILSMDRNSFVVGGYDGEFSEYIGKVTKLGQMFLGKVTVDREPKGLTFVFEDETESRADFTAHSFEILTKSCNCN